VATAPVLLDQWTVDYAHVRWLNVGLTFEGGPRHGLGHLDARLSEPLPTPRETQKNGGAGLNYTRRQKCDVTHPRGLSPTDVTPTSAAKLGPASQHPTYITLLPDV